MPYLRGLLVTLLGLISVTTVAAGQDRYVDPSNRFTLTIPPGWEARSTDVDAITITDGTAQVTLILSPVGEARLLLEQFVEQYSGQWSRWNIGRRDTMQVAGLNGQTVTATGRDPRGTESFLRISTAAAPHGPVVVISSVPQDDYNQQRPTIESIEGSIVLGNRIRATANPPTGNSPAGEKQDRAFLGVGTRALEPGEIRGLAMRNTDGAMVLQLYPGGPADEAGILTGDVIIALDGGTIMSPRALTDAVARHRVGEAVIISVIRQGRRGDLRVVLRSSPER